MPLAMSQLNEPWSAFTQVREVVSKTHSGITPTHSPGPVSSAATPVAGEADGEGDGDVEGDVEGDVDGVADALGEALGSGATDGDGETEGAGVALALGDGLLASTTGDGLGDATAWSSATATDPTLTRPSRNAPSTILEINLCDFIIFLSP
jgi:hypothetical protein